MTSEESLGDALREVIAVPTDTMITLDIPLLLTKLSQVPPVPGVAQGDPMLPDRD